MNTTEVTLVLGLVLVALGFLQARVSVLVTLLEEGHVTDLAQLWRSQEETLEFMDHVVQRLERGAWSMHL